MDMCLDGIRPQACGFLCLLFDFKPPSHVAGDMEGLRRKERQSEETEEDNRIGDFHGLLSSFACFQRGSCRAFRQR